MARCWLQLLLALLSASAGDSDADQFPCSREFTREAALYSQARPAAHTCYLVDIIAEILISAVSD